MRNKSWQRRICVTTPEELKFDRKLVEAAGYALLRCYSQLKQCIFLVMKEVGEKEPTIIMCGKISDEVFRQHITEMLNGVIPDPSKEQSL